jgi:4-hydroxy-tetrahydrodipicolinate reductase
MKLALIGYGKMGKAVEAAALKRGHEVVLKIDAPGPKANDLKGIEAAIEFTGPASATNNIMTCLEAGIPVVVGSTGWYQDYDSIKETFLSRKGSLLTATNFSIGVNLFFELNRKLAHMMNGVKDFNASMEEIHHIHKLDSPSGTALTLAEDLIWLLDEKTSWEEVHHVGESPSDKLEIVSKRIGETVGTHIVTYTSEVDKIEIKHEAFSREGFAQGAVIAAEWLPGKTGVFKMTDVLGLNSQKVL